MPLPLRAVRIYTEDGWQDVSLMGPPGPPGGGAGGSDASFIYDGTGAPSTTWTVIHNLGKFPAVTVVDTGNSVIIPNIHYDSVNQVTITFANATSGKAYLS